MDMSYATIPVFGHDRRLYIEVLLKYMVRIKTQPNNHPIYAINTKFSSSIFYNDPSFEEEELTVVMTTNEETVWEKIECVNLKDRIENGVLNMSFDDAVNR
jgi:hypothetical protein